MPGRGSQPGGEAGPSTVWCLPGRGNPVQPRHLTRSIQACVFPFLLPSVTQNCQQKFPGDLLVQNESGHSGFGVTAPGRRALPLACLHSRATGLCRNSSSGKRLAQ